ncbi:MAG: hypothetical protein HKO57_00495 [Akkermansiaceae bacterium]|nr:hypothetical protein [Akkermansiaceae bacterium]
MMQDEKKSRFLWGDDEHWQGPLAHRYITVAGLALLGVCLVAFLGTEAAKLADSDRDSIPGVIESGAWLTRLLLLLSIACLALGGTCELIAHVVFGERDQKDEDLRIDELSGRTRFARGKKVYKYVKKALGAPQQPSGED